MVSPIIHEAACMLAQRTWPAQRLRSSLLHAGLPMPWGASALTSRPLLRRPRGRDLWDGVVPLVLVPRCEGSPSS
jgi:hypothetical protein